MTGLKDKVNNYYFRVFSSALMMSIFGVAGQMSQPQNNSQPYTTQQILYGAIGQQLNQTAVQMITKNLNIQPTIIIRPGVDFNVLLVKDLSFAGRPVVEYSPAKLSSK